MAWGHISATTTYVTHVKKTFEMSVYSNTYIFPVLLVN